MNWFCMAAGTLQILACGYGFLNGLSWRANAINGLVGVANVLLAGVK